MQTRGKLAMYIGQMAAHTKHSLFSPAEQDTGLCSYPAAVMVELCYMELNHWLLVPSCVLQLHSNGRRLCVCRPLESMLCCVGR